MSTNGSNFVIGKKVVFTDKSNENTIQLLPGYNQSLEIGGSVNIVDYQGVSANILVNGNPVSSAGTLATLSDVDLTAPSDTQSLTYDSGTSKWINSTLTSANISDFSTEVDSLIAATNLTDLNDVTITTPTDGQSLTYNTGTWVNTTLSSSNISDFNTAVDGRIAAADLNDLSDVVVTTPADNQALTYNSGTGNWVNETLTTSLISDYTTATDALIQATNLEELNDVTPNPSKLEGFVLMVNNLGNFEAKDNVYDFYNLENVTINTPTEGQLLAYDSANTDWRNRSIGLDDLADTNITLPGLNDLLIYDSVTSKWKNGVLPDLDSIGDVAVAGVTVGQILQRKTDIGGDFWGATTLSTITVGTATNVAVTNETSDTTCYPVFVSSSGTQSSVGLKSNANLEYDASSANVLINRGNAINCVKSNGGGDVSVNTQNTSNTADSSATLSATVGGTSAGDPKLQLIVSGTTTMTQYVDNSDSDKLKMEFATNDPFLIATTGGNITKPKQCFFYATLSGDILNVTGDGTSYNIQFDATSYNVGSNFATSTGTFTAPVSGVYHLSSYYTLSGLTNVMNSGLGGFTVNGTFITLYRLSPYASRYQADTTFGINISTIVYLTASQTALVTTRIFSGTKVVDILASGAYFAGYLVQ